jgi:hypothetical protein
MINKINQPVAAIDSHDSRQPPLSSAGVSVMIYLFWPASFWSCCLLRYTTGFPWAN